jgi:hypothetical protein
MLPSPLGIWLESSTANCDRLWSAAFKYSEADGQSLSLRAGDIYANKNGHRLSREPSRTLMEAPQNSKRDNDARRLLRRTGPFNQPRRRPRKKPLFVVFCLIFAVSPSSAELA